MVCFPDPCEGVECPASQVCQLDPRRRPVCRCNAVCAPDFRPVCGSDGRTYVNECALRVEACKSRRGLRIIFAGECGAGETSLRLSATLFQIAPFSFIISWNCTLVNSTFFSIIRKHIQPMQFSTNYNAGGYLIVLIR